MLGASYHFSPFHLGPAGDPRERTGEDQGCSLDPQTLLYKQREITGVIQSISHICSHQEGALES